RGAALNPTACAPSSTGRSPWRSTRRVDAAPYRQRVGAMMLNPGGFSPGLLVLLVSAIGILVGLAWLHRISTMNDDPDRSSFRMHHRGTGDSRFREQVEIPTLNWLLTRGAILLGAGTVAITLFGPLVLRGWSPLWEIGPIAIVAWL